MQMYVRWSQIMHAQPGVGDMFWCKESFCLDVVPSFYKRLYYLFRTMGQFIQAEKNKQIIHFYININSKARTWYKEHRLREVRAFAVSVIIMCDFILIANYRNACKLHGVVHSTHLWIATLLVTEAERDRSPGGSWTINNTIIAQHARIQKVFPEGSPTLTMCFLIGGERISK